MKTFYWPYKFLLDLAGGEGEQTNRYVGIVKWQLVNLTYSLYRTSTFGIVKQQPVNLTLPLKIKMKWNVLLRKKPTYKFQSSLLENKL